MKPADRSPRREAQLQLERLEDRVAMAVTGTVADRLSDVVVDARSARVVAGSGPADVDGPVLVFNGTGYSDTINVTRDVNNPNAIKIAIGRGSAVFTGPFQAIVIHGGAGNDKITIEAGLELDAYVYGGTGADTITGGGGDDVLIGGDANDVLIGRGGDDLLIGGLGAEKLYGNDRYVPAVGDEENLILPDYYADEYNVVALRGLMTVWTSDADQEDRLADLADELAAGRRLIDKYNDTVYEASLDDVSFLTSTEIFRYLDPAIDGANFSLPTTDAYGFTVYTVDSVYQSQSALTRIRVLLPSDYDPQIEYKVIYVLPVESGTGSQYGDGLRTVLNAGLQSAYDAIYVAPTFSSLPWYADNVKKTNIRQESYMLNVLLPFVEGVYETVDGPEGRLLLGFSKSGYGAYTLLLRNPDVFGKAFAWDAPFAQTSTGSYGMSGIYGSEAYFDANYQIVAMLPQKAALFQSGEARFGMMSGPNFRSHHTKIDAQMTSLGIQHDVLAPVSSKHAWNVNWVSAGVAWLLT